MPRIETLSRSASDAAAYHFRVAHDQRRLADGLCVPIVVAVMAATAAFISGSPVLALCCLAGAVAFGIASFVLGLLADHHDDTREALLGRDPDAD